MKPECIIEIAKENQRLREKVRILTKSLEEMKDILRDDLSKKQPPESSTHSVL